MKNLIYIPFGIVFSILLIKVEAISWFRIQEMFHFQSFHMFGVLLSAILVALIGIQFIKLRNRKLDIDKQITLKSKRLTLKSNIIGGLLFGVGWGITGACTGPIYSLIGVHIWLVLLVLLGGLIGTFIYASLKNKLPH